MSSTHGCVTSQKVLYLHFHKCKLDVKLSYYFPLTTCLRTTRAIVSQYTHINHSCVCWSSCKGVSRRGHGESNLASQQSTERGGCQFLWWCVCVLNFLRRFYIWCAALAPISPLFIWELLSFAVGGPKIGCFVPRGKEKEDSDPYQHTGDTFELQFYQVHDWFG